MSDSVRIQRKHGSEMDSACGGGHLGFDSSRSMSLFSFINPAKDFAIEVAVKLWFHHHYSSLGQMTHIQIDSTAKTIHVELELKGEASPLEIEIARYSLHTEAGETFIELGGIRTSREWIDQLINQYLPAGQKSFKVPGALKMVL